MIHKAVKMLYQHRQDGDLLMDAPTSTSWEDLIMQAKDVKKWGKPVREIKDTIYNMHNDDERSKKEKVQAEGSKKGGGSDKCNR